MLQDFPNLSEDSPEKSDLTLKFCFEQVMDITISRGPYKPLPTLLRFSGTLETAQPVKQLQVSCLCRNFVKYREYWSIFC